MLTKLALAIALLTFPTIAFAQEAPAVTMNENNASLPLQQRTHDVLRVLQGNLEPESVFSEQFLAAVPPAQLAAVNEQVIAQHGKALRISGIEPKGEFSAEVSIRFEKSIGRLDLVINPTAPHKIEGLLLRQFDRVDDSIEQIMVDLVSLPGETSVYFGSLNGEDVRLALRADDRFAIGSTFKLYVLAALAEDIAAGERQWDDVVALTETSFPSGMMQEWPSGSPVTLHTLASMMISISDNTATDQLMVALGRERIEQTLAASGYADPAKTMPFLTTREMFALKAGPPEQLKTYRAQSNTDGMRAILDTLDTKDLTADQINTAFSSGPTALDIEWFASANDLRRLLQHMDKTADEATFGVMEINPSMAENTRKKWDYAGHKGGSEPGVLNLTWLLTDHSSKPHVLVLSWTNPDAALDNTALEAIAERLLSLPQ